MTHNTREVEEMMDKFLDAEIKWVDIENGLGKYMLASQVIEQARKVVTEYKETHHHQLQKARHDWLREEIVRLKTELIDEQLINKEGWHRRNSQWIIGMNEAFQTIIDRYQAELDQDKK